MSKDVKDIIPIIKTSFAKVKKHWPAISFVVVAGLYGILIFKINTLNHRQPSEDQVRQQVNAVKRPVIDDQTAQKLMNLEDTNQQVKALFKSARDNPFQE